MPVVKLGNLVVWGVYYRPLELYKAYLGAFMSKNRYTDCAGVLYYVNIVVLSAEITLFKYRVYRMLLFCCFL